jgi:opacity protein-like surface antigen
MKKLIVIIGILVSGVTFSQTSSKLWLGPSVGVGHAYFVPYNSHVEFQPMYSMGFTAGYNVGDYFGIVGSALYSSEGRLMNDGRTKSDIRLDYIRIPVRGILFFAGMDESVRPKISFGPSLGLLVNELGTTTGQKAETADFGMNATGGVDIKLTDGICLSAEVNYYQGFIKNRPGYNKKEYNGNIGVSLGLLFSIPE